MKMDISRTILPVPEGLRLTASEIQGIDQTFHHTTLSYKYYWLMALIYRVVNFGEVVINASDLAIDMIGMAWMPVCRHKVGLGTRDGFKAVIDELLQVTQLSPESSRIQVEQRLHFLLEDERMGKVVRRHISRLLANVPFCFISPWTKLSGEKYSHALSCGIAVDDRSAPYRLEYRCSGSRPQLWVLVNQEWAIYFKTYSASIIDYTMAGLCDYVRHNNSAVLAVDYLIDWRSDAVIRERQTSFWNKALIGASRAGNPLHCLFTDDLLTPNTYRLEHFLPSSFCSSQRVWSIYPATVRAEVSPYGHRYNQLARYKASLAAAHQRALRGYLAENGSLDKIIPEYQGWGYSVEGLAQLPPEQFVEVYSACFDSFIEQEANRTMGHATEYGPMVADDNRMHFEIQNVYGSINGNIEQHYK